MALVFRTNLIHRNIRVMLLFIKSIILLRRNSGSLNKRMACGLQAWMCDLIHRASIDKFCWWGRSLKCSLHSFNFLSVRWICALCSLPLSLFCPFRCKLILWLLALLCFPKTDWLENYPGMGWNLNGKSQGTSLCQSVIAALMQELEQLWVSSQGGHSSHGWGGASKCPASPGFGVVKTTLMGWPCSVFLASHLSAPAH